MGTKHQVIRALLTDAIIDLCRREAFYVEELRIEGTLCLVSDRSSVLVAQITEQIGEKFPGRDQSLQLLKYEREDGSSDHGNKKAAEANKTGNKAEDGENNLEDVTQKGSGHGKSDSSHRKPEPGQSNALASYARKSAAESRQHNRLTTDQTDSLVPSARTDGKYKCPFCPKVYGFKHNLKDHINKHTGKKPHVCKYCGMCFTFLASLCGHIKRRHFHCMPREHQCSICGNRFPNKQSLKQHYTWRHSPRKVPGKAVTHPRQSGSFPPATRQRKSSSPRHQDVSSIKEMKISIEGDDMFDGDNLGIRGSQGVRGRHSNAESGKTPRTRPPDTSHRALDLSSTDGAVDMSMDDMDLSQLQALGLTQPKQSPDQPLPPPGLLGLPHLPLLQATSMGFPMFPPPLPMFSLATSPSPTGQASLPPSPAPKPSTSDPIVPAHELFRSANGKFQCPYCEKAYRFKHTLKDHINTHFGKRPHVCKYCGDAFTHFASLCAHIKRRHKEHIPKDFACTICNENFMNLQSLKQHFTWRHKDMKLPPGVPLHQASKKEAKGLETTDTSSVGSSPRQSPNQPRQSPNQPRQSPSHPRQSPNQPQPSFNHPLQSPNHPLWSPGGSSSLPSMEAFVKSSGFPFPLPPPSVLPEHVNMIKDMKDFLGGMGLDNLHNQLTPSAHGPAPPFGDSNQFQ